MNMDVSLADVSRDVALLRHPHELENLRRMYSDGKLQVRKRGGAK